MSEPVQKLSLEAFRLAKRELQDKLDKPIVLEPDYDLLPPPQFEGEIILHPASLKTYVATKEGDALVWQLSNSAS